MPPKIAERALDVGDARLDLDHEQHSRHRVVCEQVDRPCAASCLDGRLPPAGLQNCRDRIDKGRMRGIAKVVDVAEFGFELDLEAQVHNRGNLLDLVEPQVADSTVLDI